MPLLSAVCGFLLLLSVNKASATDGPQNDTASLQSLYAAHRWFELRDVVAKGNAPEFIQGAVACAFNDLSLCGQKLKPVIESSLRPEETVEAHRLLASLYLRQGRYREALTEIDALLRLKPTDTDAQEDRPFLTALKDFPDQAVARRAFTKLKLADNGLPFSIHGVKATYWFDTGANVSVLSESEAKRFGIRVVSTAIQTGDVTGSHVGTRIAEVDELVIGGIRLRHVAFLIFADDKPPFNELPPGSRGLLGIPVLLALQRFVWSADTMEIGSEQSPKSLLSPNLCFDGHYPVVQAQFEKHNLAFTLDTGATNTELYPPFATTFPELVRGAEKTDSYKMEGMAGSKNMDAAFLPSLQFSIGGFPVVLHQAAVLLTHTVENSKFFHGNLGIDLLMQAHKSIFDFQAMTLTLE